MLSLPFLRTLAILNGAVPLGMLAWDAFRGQLGANAVNNALHITGILSLVFLVLSLAMTPLHWLTRRGEWIAFRRALGLYGFAYAALHLAIYVVYDRALSLSSALEEILSRRFLQIGTAAVLLMVPLALTSTNGMIQWLGPRRWKRLHRAAYVVAILGVVHYYLLVKSDTRQPIAFGLVLTGLLAARAGHFAWSRQKPVRASKKSGVAPTAPPRPRAKRPWTGELELVATFQETHDVRTFRWMLPDRGPLPFEYLPGQYLTLQVEIDGRPVRRSYTIASSPSRAGICELTIKREPQGLVSRHLHDTLRIGDRLRVTAPAGRFTFTGENPRTSAVLLIAGGVGITPVLSMARWLTDRAWPGEIFFLNVARTVDDQICRDELDQLAKRHPRFHLLTTLTRVRDADGWTGARGRPDAELLERFVPGLRSIPIYLCGPDPMMEGTRKLLEGMGVDPTRIQTEAFSSPPAAADPAAVSEEASEVAPSGARAASEPLSGIPCTITFIRSEIDHEAVSDTTLLEAAEEAGVDLPYECRSGICGQCKVRLLRGRVDMESEDALSAAEKAAGLVLACQAHPRGAIAVEA